MARYLLQKLLFIIWILGVDQCRDVGFYCNSFDEGDIGQAIVVDQCRDVGLLLQ